MNSKKISTNDLKEQHTTINTTFILVALCTPAILLYSQFLWNPVLFDDNYFFDGTIHQQYLDRFFSIDLRWLPYATFEWTRGIFGLDLIWFHLGNLIIHCATTIALFFFLRRLFNKALPGINKNSDALALDWVAFFGALIFSLHPVSVYAVAYLSQRSILMATFFSLITWRLFLEGLTKQNQLYLHASIITYLLSVLSKEHAIMVPAVCIALIVLLRNLSIREQIRLVWPTFLVYSLVGIFVVFQIKSKHILGQAYEPMASSVIPKLGTEFDSSLIYPLSMLTQTFLFFKYLWVWIVPSPAWMSVDIYQNFALSLWAWPEIVGLICFFAYFVVAVRLLLQKGINGLLGFALLCPWLLFITELSTIRIQESFVLYRSYLWMAGAFAALPFTFQKMTAKKTVYALLFIAIFMIPISWLRLRTFSHPLLLWDDAARLVEKQDVYYPGMERIFYNRGSEFNRLKKYPEAIQDLTKAINLSGEKGYITPYAYNNRASANLESQLYKQALDDFNKTIELLPNEKKARLGKALALEALNQYTASALAYKKACELGETEACKKSNKSILQ